MAQIDWAAYRRLHPSAALFSAVVSQRLPAALQLDAHGSRLPTPFRLFSQFLGVTCVGGWSARGIPEGFAFSVAEGSDLQAVLVLYPRAGSRGIKLAGVSLPSIRFGDGDYWALAEKLGYELRTKR